MRRAGKGAFKNMSRKTYTAFWRRFNKHKRRIMEKKPRRKTQYPAPVERRVLEKCLAKAKANIVMPRDTSENAIKSSARELFVQEMKRTGISTNYAVFKYGIIMKGVRAHPKTRKFMRGLGKRHKTAYTELLGALSANAWAFYMSQQ